jgi:hypothetical protein
MARIIKWLNSPFVLACLLLVGMVTDLVLLGRANDLSKSDWASWVQAVGSIAAILVSVGITNHQIRKQREADSAKEAANDRRIAEFARAVIEDALTNIRTTSKEQANWPDGLDYRFNSRPRIQASLSLIRTLITEPLFAELMRPVIDTHALLLSVDTFGTDTISLRDFKRNSRFGLNWRTFDTEMESIAQAMKAAMVITR